MGESEAAIIVMRAAAELRKAAALDRKRRAELESLADYLESIIYEEELEDAPLFPEPAPSLSIDEEIRKMMTPFRVRLTR